MKKYFLIIFFILNFFVVLSFSGCGEEGTNTGNPGQEPQEQEEDDSDDASTPEKGCFDENEDGVCDNEEGDETEESTGLSAEQSSCESVGGEWVLFTYPCEANLCHEILSTIECPPPSEAKSGFGCECGENSCWNNETSECEKI